MARRNSDWKVPRTPPRWSTKKSFEDYFRAWVMPDIQKHEMETSRATDRRRVWRTEIAHFIKSGQLPKRASQWKVPAWVGAHPGRRERSGWKSPPRRRKNAADFSDELLAAMAQQERKRKAKKAKKPAARKPAARKRAAKKPASSPRFYDIFNEKKKQDPNRPRLTGREVRAERERVDRLLGGPPKPKIIRTKPEFFIVDLSEAAIARRIGVGASIYSRVDGDIKIAGRRFKKPSLAFMSMEGPNDTVLVVTLDHRRRKIDCEVMFDVDTVYGEHYSYDALTSYPVSGSASVANLQSKVNEVLKQHYVEFGGEAEQISDRGYRRYRKVIPAVNLSSLKGFGSNYTELAASLRGASPRKRSNPSKSRKRKNPRGKPLTAAEERQYVKDTQKFGTARERAKQNRAIGILFERGVNQEKLEAYATRLTKNPPQARQLVADAYEKALFSLTEGRFRGKNEAGQQTRFQTHLTTIIKNTFLDDQKAERSRGHLSLDDARERGTGYSERLEGQISEGLYPLHGHIPDPYTERLIAEDREAIEEALEALDTLPNYRVRDKKKRIRIFTAPWSGEEKELTYGDILRFAYFAENTPGYTKNQAAAYLGIGQTVFSRNYKDAKLYLGVELDEVDEERYLTADIRRSRHRGRRNPPEHIQMLWDYFDTRLILRSNPTGYFGSAPARKGRVLYRPKIKLASGKYTRPRVYLDEPDALVGAARHGERERVDIRGRHHALPPTPTAPRKKAPKKARKAAAKPRKKAPAKPRVARPKQAGLEQFTYRELQQLAQCMEVNAGGTAATIKTLITKKAKAERISLKGTKAAILSRCRKRAEKALKQLERPPATRAQPQRPTRKMLEAKAARAKERYKERLR